VNVRRKTVSGARWEESAGPSLIDYGAMTRDELIDHFIDDNGLAQFIDTQMTGVPRHEWDWRVIARDLMAFSHYLQFSPGYCEELYDMQKERS
jgi:hypothetical protein